MQYIIVKSPKAKKLKYFGAEDWVNEEANAVKFESMLAANSTIKGLNCRTCCVVAV